MKFNSFYSCLSESFLNNRKFKYRGNAQNVFTGFILLLYRFYCVFCRGLHLILKQFITFQLVSHVRNVPFHRPFTFANYSQIQFLFSNYVDNCRYYTIVFVQSRHGKATSSGGGLVRQRWPFDRPRSKLGLGESAFQLRCRGSNP